MGGFFYGLGVSIIHLALLVGALFVKGPQFEKARELDEKFIEEIQDLKVINNLTDS